MVWLIRFEDGERAWCVFGCPELTGTGSTGHAVDRECALLREVSLMFSLNGRLIQNLNFKSAHCAVHSLTQTRAFGRPQTPTTQRHRWRTLRRAHSNIRHSQSAVRWLRARRARLRETAQLAFFIRCWLCACCSHCLNRFSTTHKTRALGPLV